MIDKNKHKKQCENCKGFKFYYEERLLENGKKLYPLICVVCGQQLITMKENKMTTENMYPECTKKLQKMGVAYPRTCKECGLGPCKADIDKSAIERCGTCTHWHKAKSYDCQHNGPWGACSFKEISRWKELIINKEENHG